MRGVTLRFVRVEYRAPAKLNLGLRLLARRPDGYHEIETVFLPLALFDRVSVTAASPGVRLQCDDPTLPLDATNLAWRAAERTCAALGVEPALEIALEKRIPVGAGLGGGSSDAAAVIACVQALHGRRLADPEQSALALALGADVPFFLVPRPALGRGVGESLTPLEGVPGRWFTLVSFDFPVATRDAYREASAELTLPRPASTLAALQTPAGVPALSGNDLEPAVARRHPEIPAARRSLERLGASMTGMSGSGPTVYGCFGGRAEAERAAERVELSPGARAIVASSPGSATVNWGWGVAKR